MTDGAGKAPQRSATLLLFLALVLCYADRQLPFLFVDPIKASLRLTDTQVSLLTGLSFAVAVSLFALPLSWIADRYDRARLIASGIAVWCAATLGCGLATGFVSLFVLRMGVGVGEAALTPAGYSLLADLFHAPDLPRPMAILAAGSLLGSVAAYNGGAAVYEMFRAAAAAGTLPFPEPEAWRAVLVAFGGAGLVLAAVSWHRLPEPRRARAAASTESRSCDQSSAEALSVPSAPATAESSLREFVRSAAFFYGPYIAAMCLYCAFAAGTNAWLAPFFARTYGWSIGATGQALGMVALSTGLLGLPCGVWLNRRLHVMTGRAAPVMTIWVALLFSAPFVIAMPFAPSGGWALSAYFLTQLPSSAATVVAPVVFTSTTPPHLRARVVALSSLCYGLLGTAVGPTLYAVFTDFVLRDPARLAMTLAVVSGVLVAALLPLLVLADRRYDAAQELVGKTGRKP